MFTAKRKGLLVFLAALFIAALIGVGIIFAPASTRPASAAEEESATAEQTQAALTFMQKIAQAADNSIVTLEGDIFFDLTADSAITAGHYLNGHLELTQESMTADTITIDLAGHELKIITGSYDSCIQVGSGITITLKDSVGGGSLAGQSQGALVKGESGSSIALEDIAVDFTCNYDNPVAYAAIDTQGKVSVSSVEFNLVGAESAVVAPENSVTYATLQDEVNAAGTAATLVTLTKDYTENITISKGQNITLDLSGKTLTNLSDHTIINYGTLTIKGEGTVDNVTHARGAFVNYGKATLLGGIYTRSKEAGTLDGGNGGNSWYVIKNSGVLTIGEEGADCSVKVTANGGYSSLIANGYQNQTDMDLSQQYAEKPVLTIYGGNFSGGLNTLKNDTLGEATIKAGEFGNTSQATILNWNTLLIEGGNFTASSEAQYAIITGADGKTETMKTTITGGEFVGEITYYSNPDYPQYTDDVDYDISGGVFANTLPEEYINDNSLFYPTEGGYKVGSYEENKDNENIALIYGNKAYASDEAAVQDGIVAKIDKTAYATLAKAVAAVPNETEAPVTVTLIGEEGATIEGSGIGLFAANGDKKNIIIDFNGLTYKIVDGFVGSTGTESQAFHLEMGNTVVLKNGTITSDVAKMLIQKYCELTLENIILDGSETNQYVVSSNAGTTTFTGDTQVIAAEGCVAFDVYYWPNGGYAEGVNVIFDKDFTGKVVGKVEYTSDGAKDDWFEKASLTFAEGNKGTFDIELAPVKSENAENAAIDIAGGEFTSALPESYIGDNSLLYPVSTEGVISYKIAQAGEVPADSVGVAQVGNAVYATLQEAIDNAPADATVTLLKDITESVSATLNRAITIDLNGYTIIGESGYAFVFDGNTADITITSGENGGKIVGNGTYGGISVLNPAADITVTVKDITIETYGEPTNDKARAIQIYNTDTTKNINTVISGVTVTKGTGSVQESAVWLRGTNATVTDTKITSESGYGMIFYGISSNTPEENSNYVWVTLDLTNSEINAYAPALSGNGQCHGTVMNLTNNDIYSEKADAIFHPQYGVLNILGDDNKLQGDSGIEMRSGILNMEGGTVIADATEFDEWSSGSGNTADGVAVNISQHNTDLPIEVNISGGTLISYSENGKAVYEKDQQNTTNVDKIAIALIGGEYNGEVESQNVTGFIAGGMFSQAVDESYMADGFALEEYNGTYIVVKVEEAVAPTVAERVNAQAEVRAYMAAFGLKLSDMQALAGEDGNAAAIVDAYDSLMGAGTATLLAEAKLAAMDAVDAFIDALNAAKADAVEQINEYAANEQAGIVTVPTYVLSAINGAASAAEVQTYLEAAKAEIDEVRAQRAVAEEQANALAEKVAGIIEALKITESEEGAWSTTLLNDVMAQLQNANSDTDAILALIGQPADGDTNKTIIDMIKDVDGDIAEAVETITKHIDNKVTEFTGEITAIKDGVDALNELFNGAEGTEGLAQIIKDIEGYVTGIQGSIGDLTEGETLASVLGDIDTAQGKLETALEQYKTSFESALGNISGKFDALDSAIAALPDSTYVAGIVQDMQKQFTGLGEKIDALTGADGALTQIDGKIDALDEVVDGIASVQNTMNEAFTEFGKQFNAAVADMEGWFDALDKAIAALPDSTDAIAELKAALAEAQKGITAANEGIAQLGTDLGTVEGKVDAIDSTADSVLAAQNALKTAVEGYKAAADEALADISESLAALDKDLAVLTASTAADKEALSKEIAALQTTANKLEDAVAALDGDSQADLTAITEDLAGLQTSLDGLKADIQKVAQSVTAVEEDSVNSASGFAGLYVFISALVVLVVAVLVVVSLKKRA